MEKLKEVARQKAVCRLIDVGVRLCQEDHYGFCPYEDTHEAFLFALITESECEQVIESVQQTIIHK